MAADSNKDTIYIDIDDEITGIIDKVRSSSGKIVALVLPKRASVLQSIVNMKLLKRSADEAKKHLVLITTESGLLPLAGAVGLHVARSLQSKPEIPSAPQIDDAEETVDEAAEGTEITAATAGNRPIGSLAGYSAPGAPNSDDMETLEIDDEEEADAAAASASAAALPAAAKVKKDKKLHVPDFERFRLLLVLGVLALILLIGGLIYALTALPKATIGITTNATEVNTNTSFALSTAAQHLDLSNNTVPAKQVQEQKTNSQQVAASGQKNTGDKAQGTVTMSAGACSGDVPSDVPAGSGLSTNGLTFLTTDDVSFVPTISHGKCSFEGVDGNGQPDIGIVAQSGGTKYNTPSGSSWTFAVSGRPDVSASGSASGGTDDIVKVVTQSDIDAATQKLNSQNADSVRQDLAKQLEDQNYVAIPSTLNASSPNVTSSAQAGDTADNVTVTGATTYTMLGAQPADLKKLIDNAVKDQIDTSKQGILTEGLDDATFKATNVTDSSAQVSMQAVATAGPHLDVDGLKKQVAGKKGGDIKSLLENDPGVTSVRIKFSPFWVTTAPKKLDRITITIAKPTPATTSNGTKP